MASLSELRDERIKKLTLLKEHHIDPYPASSSPTHTIRLLQQVFSEYNATAKEIIISGRVMSSRGQGAISFFDVFDGTGRMQMVIKLPESDESVMEYMRTYVDVGDFVEVKGKAFVTKSGQESLLVKQIRMLTKSLLPMPDKYHGIADEELRMRERHLDMLTNEELRDLFYKKAKFWKVVRNFLDSKDFLEVETPTIEVTTGGAEARPFKTHHNDFDLEVYMRICVGELWQKRLMSAGFPRTYEIGRAYRNEGSSPDHLQEFTNCEFYMAYADYEKGMSIVQELYRTIAQEVFGTTSFTTRGHTFDLSDEWKKIDYREEIIRQTGIDINSASNEEIENKLRELSVKYDGNNRERLTDTLWKYCRKHIAGPAFLVNHPSVVAPLAKNNPDGITTQVFQPILAGSELGRGYSELNDPLDQRARFEKQQVLLDNGDEEAMMPDWDFVEMLEHGMPPTCGFGFGDRLFAFFSDKPIRETQMFPLVKPKEEK
ncbi:MAG: lysyl-tRNA synthetase [Candidatus Parcubacteria bacterium]|jgi:lysyl-tRNA synthetase class 2